MHIVPEANELLFQHSSDYTRQIKRLTLTFILSNLLFAQSMRFSPTFPWHLQKAISNRPKALTALSTIAFNIGFFRDICRTKLLSSLNHRTVSSPSSIRYNNNNFAYKA